MFVLPSGRDRVELRLQVRDAAEGRGLHDPVRRGVERDDAELVLRGERGRGPQDRLLADVGLLDALDAGATHAALERVAVAGVHRARLVDDDDERHVGLLLPVADAHVDRERLLERRVGVAAGAVRPRPADGHQASPEVADVDLERGHRLVRQPQPRDIHEDDRVVLRERREVGRQRLGDHGVHELALGLERRHQLGRDVLVALDDEHLGLALDDRVRVGAVVLVERVEGRLDDDPEAQEPGIRGRERERQAVLPRVEGHGLGLGQLAVDVQAGRGRLRGGRRDVGGDLDRLAEPGRGRGRQPLHEHLVAAAEPDQVRLDLDPARGGQRRLRLAGSGGVVAVREEDDPLLGIVGEQGGGEPERRADVGRGGDRGRGDPVDLGELGGEPLDERVAAERDDARHVLVALRLERLAHVGERVLAALRPDGVGQVDDEHDGEAVDRQDELEPGEGRHERPQQADPDAQRHPTPSLAQAAA